MSPEIQCPFQHLRDHADGLIGQCVEYQTCCARVVWRKLDPRKGPFLKVNDARSSLFTTFHSRLRRLGRHREHEITSSGRARSGPTDQPVPSGIQEERQGKFEIYKAEITVADSYTR